MKKVCFVIPAHNERQNIIETLNEIVEIMAGLPQYETSFVVVDDHSDDGTYEVVEDLADSGVFCLRLSRQSGSHVALRAGIAQAGADCAICISADGQEDPACLPAMLAKWESGVDLVWALRKSRNNESKYMRLTAFIFYNLLFRLVQNQPNQIDLARADFFLLDKKVYQAVNACPERNTSLFGLLLWLGFNQGFIEYGRRNRRQGRSKWNFKSRLTLAKDWLIAFSGVPLRLTTWVGFILALMGLVFAIWIVLNYLSGDPLMGWSSILGAVIVTGAVQMVFLGIVGEYIWRNLDETRKRPLYFVEKETGAKTTDGSPQED